MLSNDALETCICGTGRDPFLALILFLGKLGEFDLWTSPTRLDIILDNPTRFEAPVDMQSFAIRANRTMRCMHIAIVGDAEVRCMLERRTSDSGFDIVDLLAVRHRAVAVLESSGCRPSDRTNSPACSTIRENENGAPSRAASVPHLNARELLGFLSRELGITYALLKS